MMTQMLHTSWTCTWVEGPEDTPAGVREAFPAVVPGQVHTDLMRAGLLEDPDVGLGELHQGWIGASTWRYATELTVPDGTSELVFDGLDTIAEVRLSGVLLGATEDQHLRYRFDVSASAGRTVPLEVTFLPVLPVAEAAATEIGPLPRPYEFPYPYVRKSACNFGWDWGPSYVTAGIWRDVRLQTWHGARLEELRVLGDLDGDTGRVTVSADVVTDGTAVDVRLRVRLADPDGVEVGVAEAVVDAGQAACRMTVDRPRFWQPAGLGEQPRYTTEVELLVDGKIVETDVRRPGLRSVSVEEPDDERGHRWALVVNGRRVRVRGYNWIPEDPFVAEVTPDRVLERLDQAVAGGANLIRVWGGGYVVDETFMTACDERGLLVWHDLLFACSAYDESPQMLALIRQEAEQAVSALSAHPSLVLWCGGNECVWGWHSWGWQAEIGDRSWGARIYGEVLPEVVARLDPTRPYVGNSPWSGSVWADPSEEAVGPVHLWKEWNDRDYTHYRESDPPFAAELGWCAPPTWSTLRAAVPDGPLDLSNPVVTHHLRAEDGVEKLQRGLAENVGSPTDPDDWIYLSQVVQARSQVAAAEWLRSRERCSGVVVWQLNDCWPAISWAAVDGAGLEKPVWFALRRSFAPRLLTIQPTEPGASLVPDAMDVVAVNDGLEPWDVEVRIRRLRVAGDERATFSTTMIVPPGETGRARLPQPVSGPADAAGELLLAEADGQRSWWFFAKDVAADRPSPRFSVQVGRSGDDVTVRVTAQTLVRDLALFPDRVAAALGLAPRDVRVDDMLHTLLPGESVTFTLTGVPVGHDLEQLLSAPPVLRATGDR